ncbi:MAG: 2-oxoacid:acceptor oxidoreductase subunit alpha [Chloroflexi bacterium]|nr:2-oxoacid:acceptor oxidoreductase subunit alpha [Chloroflexota bacterium]
MKLPASDMIIRIAGEGGEGVISAGDMFTAGAARAGYHVFTFRTYPAEIKGGHAWYQVRVGSQPVRSIGDGIDILVAFNAEAYHLHADQINPGGVLIYDPEAVTPSGNGRYTPYPIPLNTIARKELDFARGKNLVVLGAVASLFGLDPGSLEGVIRARLARRAELLDKNLASLDAGVQYTQQHIQKADRFQLARSDNVRRLVMSGNEAIVAGALTAGCRFYAGYPITPASDIMEMLARDLPRLGGVCLQSEDEIAALAAVVGASYAGRKAMTATSGPGFSLMLELLGLAGMAEIPLVLVDAQRGGPSTGMPTKLEQSDLNQALYGGHGDLPRIVMAPGSVADCYYEIIHAFNLAEEYQSPVIFLSDQSLSHRTESVAWPDVSGVRPVQRARPAPEQLADFKRYVVTESGVSPMPVPGLDTGTYVAPGLEHDEYGHVSAESPENHFVMTEKRFRKLRLLQKRQGALERYGDDAAEVGIIGWGSTAGVVREAVDRARQEGYRVAAVHPRVLHPLPEQELDAFISSVRTILVPELNYQGQFARYLASTFCVRPHQLNKFGGLPFTPGEITRKIQEVANRG